MAVSKRLFISTNEFDKQWDRMGLIDEDRRRLENDIIENPLIGPVIQGTGGLRKMRFAFSNAGKSSSARVLYVDFVLVERVYLITTYPKSQKEDISPAERAAFKRIIDLTKKELGGK